MFSNNNNGRGTYIQVPGGEYWCQVNPGTDTSHYDMNRAETYTDGTIHAPCRITENTHRTNNIVNSNPLVQNPASMDLNFMRREQSLQKERDAFYARQLENHAKFLNDAKNSFNSSIQQGAIYTPAPFKSYESWLGGDPHYYGSDFAYKNYLNEKACWDVSEKQKYNQSVSNKEGIEKQRQWVNNQIDNWDSVTDVNVLQQNLSAYDNHSTIKQFMINKINYLENLENYVNRIRSMEKELYENLITNSYENIDKKWWVNPKNASSYFEHLNNEMSIKRRVDEARELQKELYGEYETPSYKQIALDSNSKEYWGSVKQSDSYLGKLRSDKFVKDRVDEARKLEQELYGDIQTPTWDKVTKSYWIQREQSDEYLGQLKFYSFIKQQVDEARELETKLYGKSLTDTWGNVDKEWWNNQSNSANYLEELQEKLSLKERVDFVRKLEGEIYEVAKTSTWDNVEKEWWNNKTNIATYLNELNEKRNPTQKQKMEDIQTFFGVKPKSKGMVDDIFNGKYQVLNTEINLELDDSSFVGEMGKNVLKAFGTIGRQVKKVADEYPEMTEMANNLLETATIIEAYAVTKAGDLIGKEQELATNRKSIEESFKNVQRELVGFYNKKCTELGLNKDDQVGVATLGFLILATTKGGAKCTTKRRIKDALLPNEGRIRYVPDSDYHPSINLPKGKNNGYLDKFGNEWTKGPSRTLGEAFEWDIQLSEQGKKQLGWASRDGNHINVSLKGHITHK